MSGVVRADLGGEETTLRVSESGEVTFEGGETLRVDAAPSPVRGEGRPASVAISTPGADRLRQGYGGPPKLHAKAEAPGPREGAEPQSERQTRARVALVGSTAWVFIDGDVFEVELEDAQHDRARKRDRSSQGALAAPMPATVSKVLVAVGQEVAAGDTLLLLEAMKMELPIKAPHPGRITALHCQVGELVQPGVPLIEIAAP